MSEAVFANLPRFDLVADPQLPNRLKLLRGELSTQESAQCRVLDETQTELERDMVESPEQVEHDAGLASLQATLAALNDTINQLEQDTLNRIASGIQSLAAKLFPELSSLFLAEEIGRHLLSLVPVSVPEIEIRAEPVLLAQLLQVIENTVGTESHFTIRALETPEDSRVRISWQSGGLDFDFSELLNACLSRLDSTKAQ